MKLLIVEDEPELAASLLSYLRGQQYVCEVAATFAAAEEKLALFEYDCLVLDLMLPGGDGLDLLRQLQARPRPPGVIITSARDALADRLAGLHLGADDYLPKPFHLSELSARLAALLRRRHFQGSNVVQAGPFVVDTLAREATVRGQALALTRSEYDLLLLLLVNQHRVVMKSTIAEHVSGDLAEHFDSFEPVYTHVKNLKRKLAAHGLGECLRTVYGLGYRFEPFAA